MAQGALWAFEIPIRRARRAGRSYPQKLAPPTAVCRHRCRSMPLHAVPYSALSVSRRHCLRLDRLPKLRVAGSRRRSRERLASFAGPRTRSRAPAFPNALGRLTHRCQGLISPLQLSVAQWLQSPFIDDFEKVNQTQRVGLAKRLDCSCRRHLAGRGSPVVEIFACKTSTWRIGIAFALEVRDSTLLPLTLKRK